MKWTVVDFSLPPLAMVVEHNIYQKHAEIGLLRSKHGCWMTAFRGPQDVTGRNISPQL